LLSPWELLILTLFKALTECSFVPDLHQENIYSIDLTAENDLKIKEMR